MPRRSTEKNKELSEKLAERFRTALQTLSAAERREKELLQKDLATGLGLTPSGLSHLLNGRSDFDAYQCQYLASRLKVNVDDLLAEMLGTEQPSSTDALDAANLIEHYPECFRLV